MTIIHKKSKFNEIERLEKGGSTIPDFGQKYHCDACQVDITNLVRIKCAVCADFDLCVDCFSSGKKLNQHSNDHDYRVMDILDFSLFDLGWKADEEILLVDGLETFGIGNWEQIADHIGSKTKQECAEHYKKVYLDSPNWPMPIDFNVSNVQSTRRTEFSVTKNPIVLPKPPPSSQPANHDISGISI